MASLQEAFFIAGKKDCVNLCSCIYYAAIFNYKYSFLQALCLHLHLDEWNVAFVMLRYEALLLLPGFFAIPPSE